jgi:hypothetical protein
MVCDERSIGPKIILAHLMALLGDVGHVESGLGLFGDSVSVGARQLHGLRQTYLRHRNPFGRYQRYL